MAALIQVGHQRTIRLPRENDRIFSHVGVEEVSGVRNLALVCEKQPDPRKNSFHLELVNLWVRINASADFAASGVDEVSDVENLGMRRSNIDEHDVPPSQVAHQRSALIVSLRNTLLIVQ